MYNFFNYLEVMKLQHKLTRSFKMKSVLLTLISLIASMSMAQIKAIDESGQANLLRDGQQAALLITGKAVQKLKEGISIASDAPIYFAKDGSYAVVGQLDRRGAFSPFSGIFGLRTFERISKEIKNENLFTTYEAVKGYVSAYHSQCQNEDREQRPTTILRVSGVAAEQIFNFLSASEQPGSRSESVDKVAAGEFFYCEKNPQYNHADLNDQGVPVGNPSHMEYTCEFEFSKSGQLEKRSQCKIYGGIISAGGGN